MDYMKESDIKKLDREYEFILRERRNHDRMHVNDITELDKIDPRMEVLNGFTYKGSHYTWDMCYCVWRNDDDGEYYLNIPPSNCEPDE